MPDKYEPNWLFNLSDSLEEFTFRTVETSRYTIHFSQVSEFVVYDDFELSPISEDIVIHIQIECDGDSDMYITLDPTKINGSPSYNSTKFAKDSEGCAIFMKPDHDESTCDLCNRSVPRGTRLMALIGGDVSAEIHCSCWSELIGTLSRELVEDSEWTVSHML